MSIRYHLLWVPETLTYRDCSAEEYRQHFPRYDDKMLPLEAFQRPDGSKWFQFAVSETETAAFTDEPLPAYHTEADMVGVAEAAEDDEALAEVRALRAERKGAKLLNAISAPRDCDGAALHALYAGDD